VSALPPSKTLAKLANHWPKTQPEFAGVCDYTALPAPSGWPCCRLRQSVRLGRRSRPDGKTSLNRASTVWPTCRLPTRLGWAGRFSVVLARTRSRNCRRVLPATRNVRPQPNTDHDHPFLRRAGDRLAELREAMTAYTTRRRREATGRRPAGG